MSSALASGCRPAPCHRLGDANGADLVLWPEKYNLLYHCFGETTASKASMIPGTPWPEWPYGVDDGLGTIPTT